MQDLKTIKALVHSILESDTRARNSDYYLYFAVLKAIADKHSIDLKSIAITDFLLNREYAKLFPPFESVRRTRQKAQEKHPDLAACVEVEAGREINETAYREFARG